MSEKSMSVTLRHVAHQYSEDPLDTESYWLSELGCVPGMGSGDTPQEALRSLARIMDGFAYFSKEVDKVPLPWWEEGQEAE